MPQCSQAMPPGCVNCALTVVAGDDAPAWGDWFFDELTEGRGDLIHLLAVERRHRIA